MTVLVCLEPPRAGRASQQALTLALRLGRPVTVLCVGANAPTAVPLSGAHRAVFVKGSALAGADHVTRGWVLAEAVRRLKPDLILAGTASDDEGRGLVPAALAHHLHWPIVAGAQDVARADDGFAVTLYGGGQRLQLNYQCPLVVTAAPGWTEVSSRSDGSSPEWEEISLADLGVDENQLLRRPDMLGELQPPPGKPEVVSLDVLVTRWLGPSPRHRGPTR